MSSQAEQLQQVMGFFKVEAQAVGNQLKAVAHRASTGGGKASVSRPARTAAADAAADPLGEAEFVRF